MDLKNRIEGEVYFVTDTVVKKGAGSNNCLKGIIKRITNPYTTYSWDDISQQQARPFVHLNKMIDISGGTG